MRPHAHLLVLALGCGARPTAEPRPAQPDVDLAARAHVAGFPAHPVGGAPARYAEMEPAERAMMQRAVEATAEIVGTPAFRAALASLDQLDVTAGGKWLTGDAVARIYLGEARGLTALPVIYRPHPAAGSRVTATTEVLHPWEEPDRQYADTDIASVVLERVDQLPEGRACAINTFAHEWTHSIVDGHHRQVFTDGGYQDFRDPIVSYAVGAVAQCVYLQRWRPGLDLHACIAAVGSHAFEACSCAPGWIDAWIAGETTCK